jgi:outer membrane receptor for ferrienterochelin and colicin
MELRSVFDQKFNFHLGFEWQQNTFISLIGIKNQNLNSFVDTYFKLNKRISIQVKNDLQQIKPYGQALNSYLFTDANLQFTSSKKVTLTFVVNNMLNTKSYQTLSFDDIFTSISSIRLIPRYAMLRLNFGF